jgi:hypothetical protein
MPVGPGNGRRRRYLVAFALCSCALGLTAGSAHSAGTTIADGATINVVYTTSSLQVKTDTGTVISSGTTIQAGSYTIQVYDSGDFPNPKFSMTGPGVSVSSDLNSTGMGIDVPSTFGPFNLQTTSNFTISDTNMGASSRIAFSTSASVMAAGGGGVGGGGGSGSAGGGSSTGGGTATGGGTSSGAKTVKTLGTLAAAVSAAGKPTLMMGGITVKSAKAGVYKLTVIDHSRKVGLVVGKLGSLPTRLSGVAAVGTSSRNLSLTAGKWYFAASATAPKTYFSVK